MNQAPVRPEVMEMVKLLYNDNFYLQQAEIVSADNELPYILGRFKINNSGHYGFSPGHVHVPDSMAAAAQMGYAFFMQASLDGLIPEFPRVSLERLAEIARDKTGGAFWKNIEDADFKALPLDFGGRMTIASVHNNGGLLIDTRVKFGDVHPSGLGYNDICKHRMDARFIVKF
ncbi:MAG TPA: hypothetical protein VHA12_03405 [Candidatus Nanoarchaeia archaeon]|nr:hypothetical protein [Candidatus Nanoarchaeia archaeon]